MPGITHAIGIPFAAAAGYSATPTPADATYHETLDPGHTSYVDVGVRATDIAVIVTYCATRGTDRQMGTIFILNASAAIDENWEYQNDDVGITLAGYRDATTLYVEVEVDASSANTVDFDYIVERIIIS